ncbi:energy transducer TonB [Sphingosinithalassobacter portus]|uniref:energy transducer TonB n=1 Tax=Stakelama portus TaxID=2676234 RepID=UPI000D6E5B53|nr:energy transducer TonB [Sphingosinithalassobacter portus]
MSARIAYVAAAAISAALCVIAAPGALAQDRRADDEPAVVTVPPVRRTDISSLPPAPPPPPPPGEQPATRATLISGAISNEDYPPEARDAREQGVVVVQYRIETDGLVSDCEVVRSSGSPSLDTKSCALIVERFRYSPARDANGQAVAQRQTQSIRWANSPMINSPAASGRPADGTSFSPLIAWRLTVRISIADDGTITTCEPMMKSLGRDIPPSPQVCEMLDRRVISHLAANKGATLLYVEEQRVVGSEEMAAADYPEFRIAMWRVETTVVDAEGRETDCRIEMSGSTRTFPCRGIQWEYPANPPQKITHSELWFVGADQISQ